MSEDTEVEFRRCVLAFVQATEDAAAVEIVEVHGRGTDWSGSTEQGFYATFAVDVTWAHTDSSRTSRTFEGENMARLWDWIVKGGP